ncbi:DUF2577 family protein [Acidaminococcus fermentans]|uniref:DUF2577 family protein n=1 Tax=Acidaminococcus fermentans TaxID=905 RepID=UPI002491F713|nr:DUF2577 family protein [Acidaminococcus fermentans]
MAEIPSAAQSMAQVVDVMHGIAVGAQPMGTQVGIVVTPPPSLTVRMNNILLESKDLYISRYLLPNYTRHVVGETSYKGGGSGMPAYESHNHPIDNDETWTDTLQPGTLVAVIPVGGQENQLYIIADSLVKL